MDLCTGSCSAGWLAGYSCCVAKTRTLDITCRLCNHYFHTCHAYGHHRLPPFLTTFSDLDLDWGAQGQCKAKPIDFTLKIFNGEG